MVKEFIADFSPDLIAQEAKRRLIEVYDPLYIYMYGAYSLGVPNQDDDLNFLVVVESSKEKIIKRADKGFKLLFSLEVPTNLIVFTKEEFDKHLSDKTSMTFEVTTQGKLLYARS